MVPNGPAVTFKKFRSITELPFEEIRVKSKLVFDSVNVVRALQVNATRVEVFTGPVFIEVRLIAGAEQVSRGKARSRPVANCFH